jgi:hypothetical protein
MIIGSKSLHFSLIPYTDETQDDRIDYAGMVSRIMGCEEAILRSSMDTSRCAERSIRALYRKLNIGKGKKKEKDKGEGREEPEGARALRVAQERRQTNSHG